MTDQEIDKWVVDHIRIPPQQPMKAGYPKLVVEAIIKWGQNIAHTFYELGKEEGKKVVDYTAAFELEDKIRYEDQ